MHSLLHATKSGLIAAFFCGLPLAQAAVDAPVPAAPAKSGIDALKARARALHLADAPVWSALLHAEAGRSAIDDSGFLLSLPAFSPEAELEKTLDFLFAGAPDNVCRFPARYQWLKTQLDAPPLPLAQCPDVAEFREKAPADEITLVFASENLAQPASMMGHAFLKLSGRNAEGRKVAHAVSFYTDADTLNVPKLLYDSLVVGKQGFFALSPYDEKQRQYVDQEQRSMWEYRLALDAPQRELIRLHLLELKQTRLTYYFQKYNCATVVNHILALSGRPVPDARWWVTPKGVVKNADRAGLIAEKRLIAPSRWLVRALGTQTSPAERQTIRDAARQGASAAQLTDAGGDRAFVQLELARAYNQYAYLDGVLDQPTWLENDRALAEAKAARFADKQLTHSDRYDPLDTPDDAQAALSLVHDEGGAALEATVLPVSHTLADDNRAYANESGLQLFATTLKLPLANGRPILDRLTLYGMQSLMPRDELTGGLAGRFAIAYEPQRDARLDTRHALSISGALGLAQRVAGGDIDLFALAGGGLARSRERGYFYTTLEAGAVVREVWDMKTLLSVGLTDHQGGAGSTYHTVRLSQSKYFDKSRTVNLELEHLANAERRRDRVAFSFKQLF